jgi:hypothetical protein
VQHGIPLCRGLVDCFRRGIFEQLFQCLCLASLGSRHAAQKKVYNVSTSRAQLYCGQQGVELWGA